MSSQTSRTNYTEDELQKALKLSNEEKLFIKNMIYKQYPDVISQVRGGAENNFNGARHHKMKDSALPTDDSQTSFACEDLSHDTGKETRLAIIREAIQEYLADEWKADFADVMKEDSPNKSVKTRSKIMKTRNMRKCHKKQRVISNILYTNNKQHQENGDNRPSMSDKSETKFIKPKVVLKGHQKRNAIKNFECSNNTHHREKECSTSTSIESGLKVIKSKVIKKSHPNRNALKNIECGNNETRKEEIQVNYGLLYDGTSKENSKKDRISMEHTTIVTSSSTSCDDSVIEQITTIQECAGANYSELPMDNENSPFFIDRESIDIPLYQDGLERCRWNPTSVVYELCQHCDWGTPYFNMVDYDVDNGFLYSITIKEVTFFAKQPIRKKKFAKHLASTTFLQYIGFKFEYKF